MEPLLIESTNITPHVEFNKSSGVFLLQGRSLPEDVKNFYSPLLKWIDKYMASPNSLSVLTLDFDYFNTASSKMILLLLNKFKEMFKNGLDVKVLWKYPELDTELEEAGEEFSELMGIPFELYPKKID